jgi:hypothetical protein
MSTRSVTGTPPFGSSPLPSFDDPEQAAAPHQTDALPDGLDDHGAENALGLSHAPGLEDLGQKRGLDQLSGGLAAGHGALARIASRDLVLDDSPALLARVTAGFSVIDRCADWDADSAR